MSRDGVHNRDFVPEGVYPYPAIPKRTARRDELKSGGSPSASANPWAQSPTYRSNEGSRSPDVAEDPHGYNISKNNFADIKRQLHAIETDPETLQQRQNIADPALSPYVPHERNRTSPKYSISDNDDSAFEFSSEDKSPTSSKRTSITSQSIRSKTHSLKSSPLARGFREARHFAGGIIHHPSNSTEHYSILRHSHGLVFYQGAHTSIAISIFADEPLPPDRTIWLKPKRFAQTTKNRATFQEQTDDVLEVTPTTPVKADQVDPSNERAWQRDIVDFERRTRRGPRSKHALEETSVVRIPASAGDGYFHLVLCAGEETLCTSPAFRLLSVSTDMGAISGAHWTTLPLEVGAIALSMQARTMIGSALLPAKLAVKGKADSHMPTLPVSSGMAKKGAKLAFGATGASKILGAKLTAFNSNYNEERDGTFTPIWKIDDEYESGPKYPYPIRFTARCEVGNSAEYHIMPMIRLFDVPDIAAYKLSGHYFGWCSYPPNRIEKDGRVQKKQYWSQAVIVVSPIDVDKLDRVTMSRANKKDVQIQIFTDEQDHPLNNTEIKVEVYGCLRPWEQEFELELAQDLQAGEEVAYETAFINEMSDITLTQTILDEPAWGPEAVTKEEEEKEPKVKAKGMERMKQEYTEKRLKIQQKIDQVPLHKLGVRMPVDRRRDKSVVTNGYYITR